MNAAGPSGCGKTATLTTLAAAVGFDVSEWRPPPAVQWEEAQYAGIQRRQVAGLVFNPQLGMCAMREVLFQCARMPMPQHLPGLPTCKPTQALPLLPGVKQKQGGGV